jgi:peptide/nickel transport system substrate-binding protein
VRFHDGSPLTADDVVYSYRRIIDEKLSTVDKLSANHRGGRPRRPDRRHHPGPATPNLLTNLGGFKGVAIVQRRNVEDGAIATHPIGTGPFAFAGRQSGDSITLTANPDYWDGPPLIPGVTFRFIGESSTALPPYRPVRSTGPKPSRPTGAATGG